jgi:hypothetical protein
MVLNPGLNINEMFSGKEGLKRMCFLKIAQLTLSSYEKALRAYRNTPRASLKQMKQKGIASTIPFCSPSWAYLGSFLTRHKLLAPFGSNHPDSPDSYREN